MTTSSADFSLQPLPRTFGAIVTDLRLSELDEGAFADLYQAWLQYALLIVPGQYLSDAEQMAFARRFGELVEGLEAAEISNVLPDGRLRDAPDDDMMKIIRGNMHWHQDNTYMPLQSKGAVFSAKVVPRAQGDTAFADMLSVFLVFRRKSPAGCWRLSSGLQWAMTAGPTSTAGARGMW